MHEKVNPVELAVDEELNTVKMAMATRINPIEMAVDEELNTIEMAVAEEHTIEMAAVATRTSPTETSPDETSSAGEMTTDKLLSSHGK
jgi:hypothetical protein